MPASQSHDPFALLAAGATGSVLLWVAVLLGVVLVSAVVLIKCRAWLLSSDEPSDETGDLMDAVDSLKDRGRMTDAEFREIRRRLMDQAMPSAASRARGDRGAASVRGSTGRDVEK